MSTYSNAHAKHKNFISNVQFPGNWFGFGIIEKIQKSPEFNLVLSVIRAIYPANRTSKIQKYQLVETLSKSRKIAQIDFLGFEKIQRLNSMEPK